MTDLEILKSIADDKSLDFDYALESLIAQTKYGAFPKHVVGVVKQLFKDRVLELVGEDEDIDTIPTPNKRQFKLQNEQNQKVNIRNHFRYELRGKVAGL